MTEPITALTPYIDLTGRLAIATDALSRNRLLGPVIDGLKLDGEHTAETLCDDVRNVLDAVGISLDEVNVVVEIGAMSLDDKRLDVYMTCNYQSMYRLQFSAYEWHDDAADAADLTRRVIRRLALNATRTVRVLTLG